MPSAGARGPACGSVCTLKAMYIPKDFAESDPEFIREFVRAHSFATLVSNDGSRPIASQLLFHVATGPQGGMRLLGHMARVNPQWKTFDASREVLVLFQGPHTYVSAAWYSVASAPTWNYVTVQAYGQAQIIHDRIELYEMLKSLVDTHEKDGTRDQGYRIESIPSDLLEQMMNGIVGFRVDVTHAECAAKLSQNRNAADYAAIIRRLRERTDDESLAIAREMERRKPREKGPAG